MNQLQHDSLAKNAFLAPPDPRESLDHVLRMVWRRRWRFITVAGVVVAVGAILLLIQKPLYTAHATVMVESRQPDLAATDEIVHIPSQREPDVEGEIQLIVSRQALSQVVQNLNLTRNPEFQTPLTAQLMDVLCSLRTWFDSVDNKAGRSDASADSPPANLADAVVESLQKRLKVTALGRSTIVDIAFSASDRALAAQLANAIANNYVTNRYILRQREAERAGEWLRGRLELLSDDVKAKEASVEKFRRDHSTLPDGRDLELVGTDKAKLSAELTTATIDQLRLESMLAAVVARIREGGITSAFEIGESPLADHLRDTIADLRGKLASNRADRGPRHPVVVKLEEDLKATQDELANEARSYLSKLRAEILIANRNTHALEQSLQQKTSSFDQLSAAQVTYRDLERHAAASKAVYDSFLNRSKLTEQVGFNEAQSWILSSASEPLRPTSPNIPLSLVVILTTALIEKNIGTIIDRDTDYADIDENVIRAFLRIPAYKHELRSMDAIIKNGYFTSYNPSHFECTRHETGRPGVYHCLLCNPNSTRRLMPLLPVRSAFCRWCV